MKNTQANRGSARVEKNWRGFGELSKDSSFITPVISSFFEEVTVRRTTVLSLLFVASVATGWTSSQAYAPPSAPNAAASPGCQNVTGKVTWTLVPNNDAFGRYVGPISGALKGAASEVLINLTPGPIGQTIGFTATSQSTWVVDQEDLLLLTGVHNLVSTVLEPSVIFDDALTLTVTGGTGKYAGATGTINATGTVYNLLGPGFGVGNTYFDLRFSGTVCTPN